MDDQFYISLPSSASSDLFIENTKSNFKVQLNCPIQFVEEYEVALFDLIIPDLETDEVKTLYIYCNIIKNQYVGDTRSQLLRIVRLDTTRAQDIHLSNLQYLPLSLDKIHTVELSIKDDTNEYIRFKSGIDKVVAILHFKRKYGF